MAGQYSARLRADHALRAKRAPIHSIQIGARSDIGRIRRFGRLRCMPFGRRSSRSARQGACTMSTPNRETSDTLAELDRWSRHAAAANGFAEAAEPRSNRTQPRRRPMDGARMYPETNRYAKCIEVSKRVNWEIDRDVIRGRAFDFTKKFLPDGLSKASAFDSLSAGERRLVSQIQGRTYANMFGLVERFIGAKILEVSRDYWLGDQVALEALVRFTDEELKHQELFRRIESMLAAGMPAGYRFLPQPNEVASVVLGKSTWSVLGLTCLIELFTQSHYRSSIEPDADLSPLWKDVFLFHWKEESQHAILDELEWKREDAKLTAAQRDAAVDDLIALAAAIDGMLQAQAGADTHYFVDICGRPITAVELERIRDAMLDAYRWQYILSGAQEPRFADILGRLITEEQGARIGEALAPMIRAA
jgi:hypothetical protein